MKLLQGILVTCFFCLLFTACGPQKGELSGEIHIGGSSTVYPITEAIAEEYREEQSEVRVTIGVSGTGGGFQKFIRGEIGIANASRPITDQEKQALQEKDMDFVELTVAYDGLAVVVHPSNDWVDYLTVEELKKIWEPSAQEEIMTWNQIRPEWPNLELNLYGPGVASGTYDYFTEAIMGESGASRGDYMASEDDNVLVQGVSRDKNALGFFGMAYYEENQEKLKLVPIDNGEGPPVKPSLETVKNNTYAPLSRPVFIYVSEQAVKKPQVIDFVNFYIENAPALVKDVGYVAMPPEEYEKEQAEFKEFVAKYNPKANKIKTKKGRGQEKWDSI